MAPVEVSSWNPPHGKAILHDLTGQGFRGHKNSAFGHILTGKMRFQKQTGAWAP
jgi:hypothetical protein